MVMRDGLPLQKEVRQGVLRQGDCRQRDQYVHVQGCERLSPVWESELLTASLEPAMPGNTCCG